MDLESYLWAKSAEQLNWLPVISGLFQWDLRTGKEGPHSMHHDRTSRRGARRCYSWPSPFEADGAT